MKRTAQLLGFCMTAGMLCPAAAAQSHLRMGSGAVSVPAGSVVRIPSSQLRNLGQGTAVGGSTATFADFPAPGLGFDYTHLAAVNRNLSTRALIDPVTQQQLALARERQAAAARLPIALPLAINNIQIVIVQPPPVIVLPVRDEPEFEEAERPRYSRTAARRQGRVSEEPVEPAIETALTPSTPPVPPRDVTDLVLIQRDGTVHFATGYSLRRDRVIFITRDGRRHSLALELLDVAATRDMNESLGTTLQL